MDFLEGDIIKDNKDKKYIIVYIDKEVKKIHLVEVDKFLTEKKFETTMVDFEDIEKYVKTTIDK
ncbi:MAG: hypothetical protein QXN68_00845 [Thermoplasmata archaeon]